MPVFLGPVGAALIAGAAATAVVGPDKLPELGYKAGRFIGELRRPAGGGDNGKDARRGGESKGGEGR